VFADELLARLMVEAANISETSVKFYQVTVIKNPEGSHRHTKFSLRFEELHK
jgi:hypothetical protein